MTVPFNRYGKVLGNKEIQEEVQVTSSFDSYKISYQATNGAVRVFKNLTAREALRSYVRALHKGYDVLVTNENTNRILNKDEVETMITNLLEV